ncbi:hypothetical protein CYMTET_19060 [Cymbomonas tetramitiformis]|uniref:Adenylyl cyclase-associated protein n=1 Tax=Cymbomonas tetramitiformis TaxID=36881 RepID=A0AAE0L5J8_9CHLO|nr:hypothetical protein CYMTET_19060 [Cymbomonas tetramitiformis]
MEGLLDTVVKRLEAVTARLEAVEGKVGGGSGGAAAADSGDVPAFVSAFETLVDTQVKAVVQKGDAVGGEVAAISAILAQAFAEAKILLEGAAKFKQPSPEEFNKILAPTGEQLNKASALADGKRTDGFLFFKTIAEFLQSLQFVCYTGKGCGLSMPVATVDESWQSAEFYSNKLLREFKGVDDNKVEWVKAVKEVYTELKGYVKQYHATGLTWNASGTAPVAGSPGAPKPGPPPPGPPPPPSSYLDKPSAPAAAAAPAGGGMNALLGELNKGSAVTGGLKKVTDDMKSKNQANRSGAVPAGNTPKPVTSAAAKAPAVTKPPKFELKARKWEIEYQVDNKEIVIANPEPNQTVYIYNCKNCLIQVQGKVNNITLDSCQRTALVTQDVLAACEVVNGKSNEVQCKGKVPTIVVDNCGGQQIYLSKECLDATITTAKSSEVNVLVPDGDEGDMTEAPLPEQFQSNFVNGKWSTVAVQHSAG